MRAHRAVGGLILGDHPAREARQGLSHRARRRPLPCQASRLGQRALNGPGQVDRRGPRACDEPPGELERGKEQLRVGRVGVEDEGAVASRWCDEDVGPRRREYELTQQGVELAEQWLDALRARRRLDDLLVELLEGGLAELKRNDV